MGMNWKPSGSEQFMRNMIGEEREMLQSPVAPAQMLDMKGDFVVEELDGSSICLSCTANES